MDGIVWDWCYDTSQIDILYGNIPDLLEIYIKFRKITKASSTITTSTLSLVLQI